MIKLLIGLSVLLSFPLEAAIQKVTASRSFSLGHHDTTTIELVETRAQATTGWSVRHYSNGFLINGRAITDKTYERIIKDWDSIFTDFKSDSKSPCSNIVVMKTIEEGKKRENICYKNWSKDKRKKFTRFYKRLKNLASSELWDYE